MIAGIIILAFWVWKTWALSYDWSSTFSIPQMYDNSGNILLQYKTTDRAGQYEPDWIYSTWAYDFFGVTACSKIDNSTSSGTLFFQGKWQNIGSWPNEYLHGMEYEYSTWSTWDRNIYLTVWGAWTIKNNSWSWRDLVASWSWSMTSSWLAPNDFVFCSQPFFTRYGPWIYMTYYTLYWYSDSTGKFYKQLTDYSDTGATNGELITTTNWDTPYFWIYWNKWPVNWSTSIWDSNAEFFTWWYTGSAPWWKPNTPNYMVDFLANIWYSSDYISYENSLPWWFWITTWGTSWVSDIPVTGTGTTWTDYFADCGSFLDVGCYIQGFWNSIMATISDWFASLFPEVTWSWWYNTCFNTWSTSTGSNLTGSWISYIQKLANFGMVIIPISPPDWTEYCMIGWFTGTVEYQRFVPEMYKIQIPGIWSIFDLMMLLLFGVIILSSIHKHSWKWGGWHNGKVWNDAEDIKTVVHKPF